MIYLCSNTSCDDENIVHLELCKIKYASFSVDLSAFSALVISSKNAISALEFNKIPPNNKISVFAIGKASANAASKYGFGCVYKAQNSHGDEFALEIAPGLKGKKTLLLRPKEQISDIKGILEKNGVLLSEQIAYENSIVTAPKRQFETGAVFIFASPKNVEGFLKNFAWRDDFRAVAIGKSTASALKSFTNPLVSNKQNISECIKIAKNLL